MQQKQNKGNLNYKKVISLVCFLIFGLLSCSTPSQEGEYTKAEIKDDSIDIVTTVLVEKCDIQKIVDLSKKIDNAETSDILNFLLTLSKDCRNNVEYMEFSNEVLFEILSKQPETVMQLIESNNDIKKEEFLSYLSKPINDGIDVSEVIEKVKPLSDSKLKSSTIEALEVSIR